MDPVKLTCSKIAQRHGLFAATEGQLLDTSLFETIPDSDGRWKAWSKVESTKRYAMFTRLVCNNLTSKVNNGPFAFGLLLLLFPIYKSHNRPRLYTARPPLR